MTRFVEYECGFDPNLTHTRDFVLLFVVFIPRFYTHPIKTIVYVDEKSVYPYVARHDIWCGLHLR